MPSVPHGTEASPHPHVSGGPRCLQEVQKTREGQVSYVQAEVEEG